MKGVYGLRVEGEMVKVASMRRAKRILLISGVLLVGVPLLTPNVSVWNALGWWLAESGTVLVRLQHWF